MASEIRNGCETELIIPDITLERLDCAAKPMTMDANPAATNKEVRMPKDPGNAVNVVAITPTSATERMIKRFIMVIFVKSFGWERATLPKNFVKISFA
jgi:hypothetical protein